MIVLHRQVGVDHEVERLLRGAVDIDTAVIHLFQRAADGFLARSPFESGHSASRRSESAAPPHRLESRHLDHLKRLHQLVEIDAGRRFQFLDHALCERPQPLRQLAQFLASSMAGGRDQVPGARRIKRPLPAKVALPVGDVAVGDADLPTDLAIAQPRGLDEVADSRDRQIGVDAPLARRPGTGDRGRAFGRLVGCDAKAGDNGWDMRQDHLRNIVLFPRRDKYRDPGYRACRSYDPRSSA